MEGEEEDGAGDSDRGGRVEGSLVEESIVELLAGGVLES